MVTALRMAVASTRVRVDVVDALAGMDLVREWDVSGVPTMILNGRLSLEGTVPDDSLLELAAHAADPSRPAPSITSVPFRACGRLPT